jgi:hypothetical protein
VLLRYFAAVLPAPPTCFKAWRRRWLRSHMKRTVNVGVSEDRFGDPASRGHRTSAGGEWLATCEARIQRWAVFLLACVATAIRVAHSDVAQSSWAPWLDSTVSAAGTALPWPGAIATAVVVGRFLFLCWRARLTTRQP